MSCTCVAKAFNSHLHLSSCALAKEAHRNIYNFIDNLTLRGNRVVYGVDTYRNTPRIIDKLKSLASERYAMTIESSEGCVIHYKNGTYVILAKVSDVAFVTNKTFDVALVDQCDNKQALLDIITPTLSVVGAPVYTVDPDTNMVDCD